MKRVGRAQFERTGAAELVPATAASTISPVRALMSTRWRSRRRACIFTPVRRSEFV
jgi:hypothetical protein